MFAFRQSAGGTPAIRWSCLHFRIAGEPSAFLLNFCYKKKLSHMSLLSHLSLKNLQYVIC
ncbi:MAG: hypothetical protein LBP59_13615 [Planctomycetaceae bacterium]|nr:hypothetical protein [Planctomycetaceae bacterium]